MSVEKVLAYTFIKIEKNETNYSEREVLVYKALYLAKKLNYTAGIRYDINLENDSSDDAHNWPFVCIYLPNIGEISWHCPAYTKKYDSYDNNEKYKRTYRYIESHL